MAGVPMAWGYALLGPVGNGTTGTGDTWQTQSLGYNSQRTIDTAATGPKNIGEGYRQNKGVIYYAYDASFLGFFGTASNGVGPADDAFAIMNAVFTNNPTGMINGLDGYSRSLEEFPLSSQHINYEAMGLGLVDIKSITLWALVEQMGLAWPERYVWDLHDAFLPTQTPPAVCPVDEEFEVVQRNYPVDASLVLPFQNNPYVNTLYSPYVNDTLYTFNILFWPNCIQNVNYDWLFFAQSVPVDPNADAWTSVAGDGEKLLSGRLSGLPGTFFTGLTRDDAAGLRYLLTSNNINTEATAAGALLQGTNNLPVQIITTQPLSTLLAALTNDPATLLAQFPGLLVSTVTNIYVTNGTSVTAFYTNYPGPTVTNLGTPGFLNPPPNSIIPPPGQTAWSGTMDFGLFYQQVLTNTTGTTYNPATAVAQLVALYPGLVVVGTPVGYPTNVITTNFVTFLQIPPGSGFGNTNLQTITQISGIFTNYEIRYSYNFGNVMLRSNSQFYPLTDTIPFTHNRTSTSVWGTNQLVTTTTTVVGIPIGAPVGNGPATNTTSSSFRQYGITGDFFLEPTNWCGFSAQLLPTPTVLNSYSNVVVTSGVTNTQTGTATSTTTTTTFYNYTNGIFWVSPGVCEPVLQFATNLTSAVVTNYQNTLLNLYTNFYSPGSTITIITTNIYTPNGAPVGTLVTNVTTATVTTNLPTGDYFIIPAAWCGFTIQATLLTNVVYTTNTTVTTTSILSSNGVTSTSQLLFSQTQIAVYTNHNLRVQPWSCTFAAEGPRLREGIQKIKFVRANFDSLLGQFFQPITNNYTMMIVTNSQTIPESFQRVVTQPDIVLSANDEPLTTTLPTYNAFGRSFSFDQANILPNLAGPGVINSPATFTYNKAGNLYLNGSLSSFGLTTNSFLNEATQSPVGVIWASFDASTNDPVVYPNGTSLQNLANQLLIQITPAPGILPDGANGVPYTNLTFTATGGAFTPPYTWGVAPGSLALPQGLTLTTVNSVGTLSGTPVNNPAGTFDFTIQLTDSVGRSVSWNYTMTIH